MPTMMQTQLRQANMVPGRMRKHHYDRHRVVCSADDRATAARLGGHTWNIISNKKEHEIYMLNGRSNDHYIDEHTGAITSDWFEKKMRVQRPQGGTFQDSDQAYDALECPPTAGKEAAHLHARQTKQLCQIAAPRHYGGYADIRDMSNTPRTPGRTGGDSLDRMHPFQHRDRDVPSQSTPRVVEKRHWAQRRGELRHDAGPPDEHEMFRSLNQLRTEPHMDLHDSNFAEHLHNNSRSRSTPLSAREPRITACTHAGTLSMRCPLHPDDIREAHHRTRQATQRIEPEHTRNITSWPLAPGRDKLKKGDAFFEKPVQQTGSSSVKHDIITGQQRDFWY